MKDLQARHARSGPRRSAGCGEQAASSSPSPAAAGGYQRAFIHLWRHLKKRHATK